ncbi:hypothetical protein PNOK_0023600 [Pyrrhoderma noxium]|uniref:Uncharacterized protein n=1 Tax=Pyrrhoderma noxium TaxID=2282107 RepID=A0A286UUC3_9AGAM|nr:hypothetical protein PNOK_0023600 [Pyrrhoderma noxium]
MLLFKAVLINLRRVPFVSKKKSFPSEHLTARKSNYSLPDFYLGRYVMSDSSKPSSRQSETRIMPCQSVIMVSLAHK